MEIECGMAPEKTNAVHKGWCYGQFVKPTGVPVAAPKLTFKAPAGVTRYLEKMETLIRSRGYTMVGRCRLNPVEARAERDCWSRGTERNPGASLYGVSPSLTWIGFSA